MRRLMLVLAVLAVTTAGCAQPDVSLGSGDGNGGAAGGTVPQLPDEDPFLKGEVVAVNATEPVTTDCVSEADLDRDGTVSSDDPPICNPNPHTFGSIHVRGDNATGESEIVATVGKDVPIVRRDAAGNLEPAAFEDISKGDTATLWITGPVMESFPVQGSASYVAIEAAD
jgi:hypothetical protein